MFNEGNNNNDDSPTLLSKSSFFESNTVKAVEIIHNSSNVKNDGMVQCKKSPPGFLSDVTIFLQQLDLGHHAENLKKIGYSTMVSLKSLTIRQLLGWDWCYAEAHRLLAAIRAYIHNHDEKDGSGSPSGGNPSSHRNIRNDGDEPNNTRSDSKRKRAASTYPPRIQETNSQNSSPPIVTFHSEKSISSSIGQEMKNVEATRADVTKKRKLEDERDFESQELLESRHKQINNEVHISKTNQTNSNSNTNCSLSSASKPSESSSSTRNDEIGRTFHGHNERKRLEYALDVLGANTIKAILKVHVASGSEGVRKVAAVLTPELAPAVSEPLALCFRCGNRFDPQYKSKCVMPHPTEAVEYEEVDITLGDKRFDFKCSLCSKSWQSASNQYREQITSNEESVCWRGAHDPYDEEVRQREGWGDPLILGEDATNYVELLKKSKEKAAGVGQVAFDVKQPEYRSRI
mmetsp:Transcript_36210/g.61206  ORF Transcript_36210/g.61206 Transcript_36210/m.61206 type:complete len:460 (-) Transcript_36210:316-1695(-)